MATIPLPFIDDFSLGGSVSSVWDLVTSGTVNQYSGNYYGSNGQFSLDLANVQNKATPTVADPTVEYTIVIRSGPTGFNAITGSGLQTFDLRIPIATSDGLDTDSIRIISANGASPGSTIAVSMGSADTDIVSFDIPASEPAGAVMTINVKTGIPGDSLGTVTVSYFSDGIVTPTPTYTTFLNFSSFMTNIWVNNSGEILAVKTGAPATSFSMTAFELHVGEVSCFAHDSLIETVGGLKPIQDLTTYDRIVGDDGTLQRVVNVWRTFLPVTKQCLTRESLTMSINHSVRHGDQWKRVEHTFHDEPVSVTNYFYQIQTTGYGYRVGDYSFSTWTADYTETKGRQLMKPLL